MKQMISSTKRRHCKPLLLALAVIFAPIQGTASILSDDPRLSPATLRIHKQDGFTQVYVDGYIHRPTVEDFASRVTDAGATFGIVYFNSAGGDLTAAQDLGRLIRAKGYATQIGKLSADQEIIEPGLCESACPIAFVGGRFRLLDSDTGKLGVHRFYVAKQNRYAADSKMLFTAERDLRAYLVEMGISTEFYDLIMKTPTDTVQTVSKRSAYAWNVSTDREHSVWRQNGTTLTGSSETATGGLTISFDCHDGSMQVQAGLKPWFPVSALLNYDKHSIVVNGIHYPVSEVSASYSKDTGYMTFTSHPGAQVPLALLEAESVGYSLSFDEAPGEYKRTLRTSSTGKPLASMAASCSSQP